MINYYYDTARCLVAWTCISSAFWQTVTRQTASHTQPLDNGRKTIIKLAQVAMRLTIKSRRHCVIFWSGFIMRIINIWRWLSNWQWWGFVKLNRKVVLHHPHKIGIGDRWSLCVKNNNLKLICCAAFTWWCRWERRGGKIDHLVGYGFGKRMVVFPMAP